MYQPCGTSGKADPSKGPRAPCHSSASLPLNAFLPFSNWPFQLPSLVRNTLVCPHLQKGGLYSRHSRRLHTLRLPPPPPDTVAGTRQASAASYRVSVILGSALEKNTHYGMLHSVIVMGSENRFRRKERPGWDKVAKESGMGEVGSELPFAG